MSLKEALDYLDEAVPALPGQVDGVREESAAFREQAGQLLEDFEQRRSAAKELFEKCRQALAALEGAALSQASLLQEHIDAVESRVEGSAADFEASGRELTGGVTEADTAMERLGGLLTETGDASRAAEERVASAGDAVGDAIDGGSQELGSALEQATAEASGLAALADEVREGIGGAAQSLRTEMNRLLAEGQGRIEETLGRIAALKTAHDGVLARELDHLDAKKSEVLDLLEGSLKNEVEAVVGAAVETVIDALTALGSRLQGAKDRAADVRGELEGSFAALESAIEPFPGYIDSVKAGADLASLPWA